MPKMIAKEPRSRSSKVIDAITIEMSAPMLSALDGWRAAKDGQPDRAEAVRRLVEIGLSVKEAVRPSAKAAARAAELASKAIDKHIHHETPIEERERAKRRIVKGPSVFRNVRKD